MAGDWIKMRHDLADDPAVVVMAQLLGLDADAVVGKLHRIWSWADRHTKDGRAPGIMPIWIDNYVNKSGFASAMEEAGWLTIDDDAGVAFPRFKVHNGDSAKARASNTKRQKRARQERDRSATEARQTRDKNNTRAEQSRVEQSSREQEQDIAQRNPAPEQSARDSVACCSLLLAVRSPAGHPVFDHKAAAAIAKRCDQDRTKVLWALTRYDEEVKRGNAPSNPAGWIRSLIEREEVPGAFVEDMRRVQLAALAKRSKVGGAA